LCFKKIKMTFKKLTSLNSLFSISFDSNVKNTVY